MNTALKRTLLSTLVMPFALGAASAIAAPISSWNYTVVSSLNDSAPTFTSGTGSQNVTANEISWGSTTNPAERSSVGITNVDSVADSLAPVVTDSGVAATGGVFTHTNSSINANFATLKTFDLSSTLTLMPIPSSAGNTEVLPTITFNARFTETPNNPSDGICADGNSTPCGDIFTIVSIENLGPFSGGMLPGQEFTQGGYIYTVFLELATLMTLPPAACAAAGASTGCFGLLTPEGGINTFQSSFTIEARKVPEPGTLALLGLGLAGLGLSRRKKAAKA